MGHLPSLWQIVPVSHYLQGKKKKYIILPYVQSKPILFQFKVIIPCPTTSCFCEKSPLQLSFRPPLVLEGCYRAFSSLDWKTSALFFFREKVFQPSDYFSDSPLNPILTVPCLPCTGYHRTGFIFQVTSHESGIETDEHPPQCAGHVVFYVAQDRTVFLGYKTWMSCKIRPRLVFWAIHC